MDASKLLWNIGKIFKYNNLYQEHCGDNVEYYDCELLIDFGPYKKGDIFDTIEIESRSHGDFSMNLHNDHGGAVFVPVWTHVDSSTL